MSQNKESIYPKAKELQDDELQAWKYVFGKIDDFEKRINTLEKKKDE